MLSVIILSVVMLSVIMLSVVMLSVIMLSVVMLSVVKRCGTVVIASVFCLPLIPSTKNWKEQEKKELNNIEEKNNISCGRLYKTF